MTILTPQMLRDIIALNGPMDMFEMKDILRGRIDKVIHNQVMLTILKLEETGEITHNPKTGQWTAKKELT